MPADARPAADPEELQLQPSSLEFPVVGIGASAGGLGALQQFFGQLPARSGMAYVVILHLSPAHESNAAEILQRCTAMPVVQVQQAVGIEANHVYIIPPTSDLTMDDGRLRLQPSQRSVRGGAHAAIDLFFRTLGQVHRERGIAIVMSGTGSDGAVGLTRVKEAGGVTLAQSPDDAEYDGMPRAAVATGMVDIVLPVADMPQRLLELWSNMRNIRMPADMAAELRSKVDENKGVQSAEAALADVMTLMRLHTRHDFKHYKRATMLRRIERRLQVNGLADLAAYRDHIKTHPAEAPLLLQDLLISVTNFFRDREAFEALEREVLPAFFENRREGDEPVRVWVAGCATGEEAYSIAILLREQLDRLHRAAEFQVFATDIDERAIGIARAGLYPGAIKTDVSPARLDKYFIKEGDNYRIIKPIREKVLFAAHNVLRDPPFSRLDLVCCRNLLIYLERRAQASILGMFHFALRPQGALFLGVSESPDAAPDMFKAVDKKNRIFRAAAAAGAARNLPTLVPQPADGRPAAALPALSGERRPPTNAEIHSRSLEQLLPPSVLVDANLNILHLSDGAGRYMEHGSGVPSHGLLANVSPELRLELRSAFYSAAQSRQNVEVRNVRVVQQGQPRNVHLSVRPFKTEEGTELALVVFDESGIEPEAPGRAPADAATAKVVAQLEQENRQLKEHLQEVIEHAETSTEELKASNEELQAINEELRSATEELETSKEELQSTNEELTTVNYELKSKVEETALINDDLQNYIASTDIATVFVDRGLQIKRFTPQSAQLFNLIASDVGRSLLDITHKLDYPSLAEDARQAFVSLRVIERAVRTQDGRHFLARFLPYRTTEDKIVGAVLTFVDVTALRAAQEQARSSDERLRLAAEATHDFAIITTDEAGLVSAWNAGAARMFQWREDEIIGQPLDLIFTEADRAAGVPAAELERARTGGRAEDERWHRRKDGSTFYCSGVTTPLGGSSDARGFACIARDMTEHKQLTLTKELLLAQEQALRQQAQAASSLKDEFLAVMSHELKHPLNLIHVNAELLGRMPETRKFPAVARAGEAIRRAAASQAKIIDDLLDLSRVRTGKMALRIEDLVINESIAAIVRAAEADAQAKGVALSFQCTTRPVQVRCDQVRLEQVAWNLVSNAIKFTPEGGQVTVSLDLEPESHRARLMVADTGRGIEPQFLPHIFEMFSQGGLARGPGERGLGIGLALVRELVETQGGQITASSGGLGQGATFSVRLPLVDGRLERELPPAGDTSGVLAGVRILLVDDSKETLQLFKELLELEDARIDTADGGEKALAALQSGAGYDLLISDLGMPVMDGYQLIAAVRKLPQGASLKALALSGYGREVDVQRAVRAGFDGHLSKPASVEAVKDAWRTLLGAGKA